MSKQEDENFLSQQQGAGAWQVTPNEYLKDHPPTYKGERLTSCFVPMRDGIRLAIDVHLPGSEQTTDSYPVILMFTPYYRRFALAANHSPNVEACPNIAIFRDMFVPRGYAIVAVDIRGCGASFGSRDGFRSPRERDDYYEIAEWVTKQDWCDGNLGATGISYVGAASDFLASTQHSAVKAIVPVSSVWDTWSNHLYPGGVLFNAVTKKYGELAEALDQGDREAMRQYTYFADTDLEGPAPVEADDGTLLAQALKEHMANFDMQDFAQQFRFRDDGLSDNPAYTSAQISPYFYAANQKDTPVASYGMTGWHDGPGFTNGSIQRYQWQTNPKRRLLIGAWDHGARSNSSPWAKNPVPEISWLADILRFFDAHLRGYETGLEAEMPIHYFTCGEEKWKRAQNWPLPETKWQTHYLGPNNALVSDCPNEGSAKDTYQADFDCRTGFNTRYDRLYAANVTSYYRDWNGRDENMLCYTTPPLELDTEVTGHPEVTLHLSSSEPDCAVIIYLEDVAPDGKCRYVTEGIFRALHRKRGPNPIGIPETNLSHSFNRHDAELLVPGEISEIAFEMLPTSYQFKKGHSIRIAIAAADSDHLSRIPDGRPPLLNFFRSQLKASNIALPIIPKET